MAKSITTSVTAGKRFSILYDGDGLYYDVVVTAVKSGKATIVFEDETIETVSVDLLEPPLNPAVPDRYDMLETLIEHTVNGNLTSLVVTGQPGIGKTYTVQETLDRLGKTEDIDYVLIKGHSTPFSLYKTLYDNSTGLIVFDDCDSVFDTELGANILKAVLDTTGRRKVSWKSTERTLQEYPDNFEFTGQVIFLSNLSLDDIPAAVLSRSVMIDLWLNNDEMIELMTLRTPAMIKMTGATAKQANDVVELINKYRDTIPVLSLRTLFLGLKTYVATGDLSLVRYQILRNSR